MDKDEIQNKIEQLEKELNELKKITQSERWKPYTEGFNIEGDYYVHALPPGFKNERFRTRELAKLRQKQIEAENELFNIWEYLVGDWRPNWRNKSVKYYMIIKYHEKDKIWLYKYFEYFDTILNVPIMPIYRYFPSQKLAQKQYELASDHAKAYMRGEF